MKTAMAVGNVENVSSTGVFQGRGEGWDRFTVPLLCTVPSFPRPCTRSSTLKEKTMPLGKRWIGCMLIGIGLMLFGVSQQSWEEWAGFAVLAGGIVLVLPNRITGSANT